LLVGLLLLAWLAWEWLLLQPGPIQTGLLTVLAAVIAFFAAYIGVREHSRREQKAREIDMRREAYFALAEAVANKLLYLWSCADVTATDSDLRALVKNYNCHVARFHLVGSLVDIEAFLKLDAKLNENCFKMTFERASLQIAKRAYDSAAARFQALNEAAAREQLSSEYAQLFVDTMRESGYIR
jgi:hypothetical protein